MARISTEIAIVGTGIIGIATAYYLARNHGMSNIVLIDKHQPMAFTSAQSGENYRNWWPHPAMVAFTNRSIDLLEEIARETDNRINMSRRGYALATREPDIDPLVDQLYRGLGDRADALVRTHNRAVAPNYQSSLTSDRIGAPDGVDVLRNQDLIRQSFPSFAHDVRTVVHIRRGGDISGQQLGMHMLEYLKERGVKQLLGTVEAVARGESFGLAVQAADGVKTVRAGKVVNAAGPFAGTIAGMLDIDLPLINIVQQKIAFEDRRRVIPRAMPFSIDLDGQRIDWSNEDRDVLLDDPDLRRFTEPMPGSIHCRPDGGDRGSWVKLGWAFNNAPSGAAWDAPLDDTFPEIVLRGASRLNPGLKAYYGQLPRGMHHYGGWYTMTEENWPLIGPMGTDGAFVNCGYSGFGTMAACAGGELCAAWVAGGERPDYAEGFSLARLDNPILMKELRAGARGIL